MTTAAAINPVILHNSGGKGVFARLYFFAAYFCYGIAAGLLITALHNAGVATLTHTPSPMKFLNQILGRPAHERPFL